MPAHPMGFAPEKDPRSLSTDARLRGRKGGSSVYEIDNRAVAPVQKSDELTEIWRGYVVVDGVEIAVIGDIERIEAQPNMVDLAAFRPNKRNLDDTVDFYVQ